jgi:AcrR family transcriptional regulator
VPASTTRPDVSTARIYRGASGDERQAVRRKQLLDAGLELFGTRGIASTRIDDICAEAGLTKRYFYENFRSIDDLTDAVLDTVLADLIAVVLPAVASGGWRNPRPALSAFIDTVLADPRLVRLLVVETHNGALSDRRQQLIDLAVDTWLGNDPGASISPEHLPAQRLLAYAMAGAAGEIALAWLNGRIEMRPDEITEHVVRIFEGITPRPKATARRTPR